MVVSSLPRTGARLFMNSPIVSPPLTGGARLIRGFRRIGLVLAILIFGFGTSASVFWAAEGPNRAIRTAEAHNCIYRRSQVERAIIWEGRGGFVDPAANRCPWEASYIAMTNLPTSPSSVPSFWWEFLPSFGMLVALFAALAGMAFGASWATGWVLAGFSRD